MPFLDFNGLSHFLDKIKVAFVSVDSKGVANGVAGLDANGKIPSAQLPSYVDDVEEYDAVNFTGWTEWVPGDSYVIGDRVKVTDNGNVTGYVCIADNSSSTIIETEWRTATKFPVSGESGKIYIDAFTNITYRWGGSSYVPIGSDLALGETSSTAYRGDRGAAAYAAAVTNVDSTPTASSTNLITSGGVAAAIPDVSTKADKSDTVLGTTLSRGRKSNTTVGTASFAFGTEVTASGSYSHAEGNATTASGTNAHAEGYYTTASGAYGAHSEGGNTTASGIAAHAEGYNTTAYGNQSHAEGGNTIASNNYSHAEGTSTTASGYASHAEGYQTQATGKLSHVFGQWNVADTAPSIGPWVANTSYSVGDKVLVSDGSSSTRYLCKTANNDSEFNSSKWYEITGEMNYVEVVGNGRENTARSNARALDWDGNERLKGTLYVGCNADSTGGVQVATVNDASSLTRQFYSSADEMSLALSANGRTYMLTCAGSTSGTSGAIADTTYGALIIVSNGDYIVVHKGSAIVISVANDILTVTSSSNIKMAIVEL